MAERRMFAKTIVDSDAFLDMPLSTQALYFHLSMRADDDGFLNNAQKIMRMVGAARNDLDLLIAKRFVIAFPDGICVIKHWRIHNYLRSDRYKPTVYEDERAALSIKENGAYTLDCPEARTIEMGIPDGTPDDNQGIPSGDGRLTQDRIGKVRTGKERLGEKSIGKPIAHARGSYGYVLLTDDEYDRLIADLGDEEARRVIDYIDESASITKNKNKWKNWNLVLRKASREGWGKRAGTEAARNERDYSFDGFKKGV